MSKKSKIRFQIKRSLVVGTVGAVSLAGSVACTVNPVFPEEYEDVGSADADQTGDTDAGGDVDETDVDQSEDADAAADADTLDDQDSGDAADPSGEDSDDDS